MKIVRVVSLLNSGDNSVYKLIDLYQFYRVFSKFLDRIVYNRLINFKNKYEFSSPGINMDPKNSHILKSSSMIRSLTHLMYNKMVT